jgi:serine/threonine-protein kinase
MTIATVTRILEELASALEYAHSQRIVHRDMKPENVMFFHDRAVVLDFGIGKALTAASESADDPALGRITQRGMSLGTPTYVSPEQAAGDPELDHRADIYSLGILAYEMLCGHPPFSGRSAQAVLTAHANQAPEAIGRRRPDTPAHLAKIVMQCLEKSPAARPQRAGDIVRALRPLSAGSGEGIQARLARIPAWVPWALAALATVLAVILALR